MSDTTNRVRLRHWLWLVALMITVWVLAFAWAEKSQGETFSFDRALVVEELAPVRGDLGFITAGTNLCHTESITSYTIEALGQWTALIERLEAAGGAAFLSEEDNDLGSSLSKWCSTLGTGYPVVVFHVDREHALVSWEKSLDFGDYTFIIRVFDFQAGGLRL